MSSLDIDIICERSDLERIGPEWQSCFERSNAQPYLSFEWFSLYQKHFGSSSLLRIAVAYVDGHIGAILPLEKVDVRIGPVAERVLQFSGDGFAPWLCGLSAEGIGAVDVFAACLEVLRREDRDWAFVRLSKVPVSAPFAAPWLRSTMPGSVQIILPESWSQYLEALPASRRHGIRRRVRGLHRKYSVEVLRVCPESDFDQDVLRRAIDGALAVSASSWQAHAKEGLAISDAKCRGFFIEASNRMAQLGALDLSVLFLDGHPVSFLWGAARGTNTSISKLGFDAGYGALSPGRAHIALHIEDSIRRGLKCIDFGHEFAEQKRQWSDEEMPLCELWYFPPRLKSSLYRNWYRVRRGVK